MADHSDVTQAQFDMVKKFVDASYSSSDGSFLAGLLAAASQNKGPAYAAQHGYEISKPNHWKALKAMTMIGPHFDLRLAGGVYRFKDNALGLSELFVNSSEKTVHVDGELMKSVKVNNGGVAFSNSSGRSFNVRFHCPQLIGEKFSEPLFQGETFTTGDASTRAIISGKRYYPWGRAGKRRNELNRPEKEDIPAVMKSITEKKVLAAAMVRVNAMAGSIPVCMDLMTGSYEAPAKTVGHDAAQKDYVMFGLGNVVLTGAGLFLNLAGVSIGAWYKSGGAPGDEAIGAGFGALGAQSLLVSVAFFQHYFITKQSMAMTDWIRQYGVKGDDDEEANLLTGDVVAKTVREEVGKLDAHDLKEENKIHVGVIKSKVESAYTRNVKAELGQVAYNRFRGFRLAAEDEYRKLFDAATEAKFKADIGPDAVEKLINRSIDQKRAEAEKPKLDLKLSQLKAEKEMLDLEKEQSLLNLKTKGSAGNSEREKEKIKEKYKKDMGEKEEKEKKLEEEKREAERVAEGRLVEKAEKEVESIIKQNIKNERDSQRDSRKKVPRGK